MCIFEFFIFLKLLNLLNLPNIDIAVVARWVEHRHFKPSVVVHLTPLMTKTPNRL